MEVKIAKISGFCQGVNNAVSKSYQSIKSNNSIYCLGELVHNERVIEDLETNGMIFVESLNDVPNHSKVIFRAHGEPKERYQEAISKNLEIIDLTCPKVKLIHQKMQERNDACIFLIGKHSHPESIASISYAKNGLIIETEEDIEKSNDFILKSNFQKIYILSQTTMSQIKFNNLVSKIKDKYKKIETIVDNTICNATFLRQKEVMELSKKVNKMIIIGGKNSSNTKELYNISQNICNDTYLIHDSEELKNINFNEEDIVGISAGASTPDYIILEVKYYLENLYTKKLHL